MSAHKKKRLKILGVFLIIAGVVLLLNQHSGAVERHCNAILYGDVYPNIPTVDYQSLTHCRPQVQDTLGYIDSNGPFPIYGSPCDPVCDNRLYNNSNRKLPILPRIGQDEGYREYTVITPNSPHRGAHRIVTGGDAGRKDSRCYDVVYYTDNHYDTYVYIEIPDKHCA